MSGITGQGTTFDLPNFTGELFSVTPQDTPFLSSIGGLTGGRSVNGDPLISWQYYDLRDAESDRQRVEGGSVDPEQRVRRTDHNVVEIHQEAVELSYTKQAAVNQVAGSGSAHPHGGSLSGSNPVQDEMAWQLRAQLVQKARDIEVSFLTGTFANPASNATPRRTRGLVAAIERGVVDADDNTEKANVVDGGGADLTEEVLLNALQEAWENGGLMIDETRTAIVNAYQKRKLTEVFITDKGYAETTRDVGGVHVSVIETDFGRVNIMLNRHASTDQVVVASLEQCVPRFLEIPGKGHFFVEPLAKSGASDEAQLYGEVGLEYGNPIAHALIDNLEDGSGS